MTVVLGLKTAKGLIMGSDSFIGTTEEYSLVKEPKVFKKGTMAIGISGYTRMWNILRYDFNIETQPKGMSNGEFIYRTVELLRNKLAEVGYNQTENEVHSMGNNWLLIGYRGEFYEITSNYGICMVNSPYAAIGPGISYGLSALTALDIWSDASSQQKVLNALQVTADYVPTVKAPFHILELAK